MTKEEALAEASKQFDADMKRIEDVFAPVLGHLKLYAAREERAAIDKYDKRRAEIHAQYRE